MTSDLFECFECGDVFESEYGPVRCESCNSVDIRYVLEPKDVRTGWGKLSTRRAVESQLKREELVNEN